MDAQSYDMARGRRSRREKEREGGRKREVKRGKKGEEERETEREEDCVSACDSTTSLGGFWA